MLFDSGHDLVRLAMGGTLAYAGLVLLLRTTGKRTLSKINASISPSSSARPSPPRSSAIRCR